MKFLDPDSSFHPYLSVPPGGFIYIKVSCFINSQYVLHVMTSELLMVDPGANKILVPVGTKM